jgi:uncharacterized protein (DUF2252 family)
MATSIVLAGREAKQRRAALRAAQRFVASYCRSIAKFAEQPILQVARHHIRGEAHVHPIQQALRQSERSTPLDLLKKYAVSDRRGRPSFGNGSLGIRRVIGKERTEAMASLRAYRESLASERKHLFDLFRAIDVGFKVVGTGSIGLRDYVVLFEGNGPKDPLFLQIKQEVKSAYAPYLKVPGYPHQGRRVADAQRSVQPVSDLLLGWTAFSGHEYLVRQLNDHKGSVDLKTLKAQGLESLAVIAGELLARGHARSGDACAIYGYCGSGLKITDAIGEFAQMYAEQTEADYAKFMAAVRNKGIKVAEQNLA